MDAIRVKEGVSPSQVSLVRDEDDLLVRIAGADMRHYPKCGLSDILARVSISE